MIEIMPPNLAAALERLDLGLELPMEIPELHGLLYGTVLHGGKRFRPGLCFLMGGVLGVPPEQVSPYARIAEFMHAATLAHDDVIDEATKRRNRPTLNVIATNQKAVLTGDLLLARVVSETAQLGNIDILKDGSRVLEDLVRGEWLQISHRGWAEVDRGRLEEAARRKTASLMAWCCTTPARLAGNDPELVARCENFGNLLGLAFQMADDILDFEEGGEKTYGQDLSDGLVNFVALELGEMFPSLRPEIPKLLYRAGASEWPWTIDELERAKTSVRNRIRAKTEAARIELDWIRRASVASEAEKAGSIAALEFILDYVGNRST